MTSNDVNQQIQAPQDNKMPARTVLIKDALIFQGKLSLDALRDILLSPISILCLIIDIAKDHNKAQSYYYKLMALGHRTDHWLNLFGYQATQREQVRKNADAETIVEPVIVEENIDEIIEKFEGKLANYYQSDNSAGKQKIEQYLAKLAELKNTNKK